MRVIEQSKTILYLCDRANNKECRKTCCVDNGGECYCTLSRDKAQKNNDGEPIVAEVVRRRGKSEIRNASMESIAEIKKTKTEVI